MTSSIGVEAGDIVNLNLAYNKDHGRIILREYHTLTAPQA
jgi:hypothetical protein